MIGVYSVHNLGNPTKLGDFQLQRLRRALWARAEAGNRLAVRLADRAIVSLLAACDEAGVGDDARAEIAKGVSR